MHVIQEDFTQIHLHARISAAAVHLHDSVDTTQSRHDSAHFEAGRRHPTHFILTHIIYIHVHVRKTTPKTLPQALPRSTDWSKNRDSNIASHSFVYI